MFIKQYWAIENCQSYEAEHIQRIVPSGLTELTFYLEGLPHSLDAQKNISSNSVISGHLKKYYDISVRGSLSMFSVSFMPFGVRMFLNIPADELYDLNVPFRYLVSDIADRLEDALYETPSFTEKVQVTEKFLKLLLQTNRGSYELERICNSYNLIKKSMGAIPIDSLSGAACLSRKQFERVFSAYVGTSPKQFLKTVRFQGSLHLKHVNPSMPLTELAYHSGYYDQAHMINDYKLLSGKTPGEYFRECEPFSDFFDA